MLIVFSGLPAAGKTTLARALARELGAVYLRIDSIEQAIRDPVTPLDDAGYRAAYAIAADNLRLARTVIADCVNPIGLTRDAWRAVASRARTEAVEVEIQCSDPAEHRRRAQSRTADIPGHQLPAWNDIASREYHPWTRPRLVIDTAGQTIDQSLQALRDALQKQKSRAPGEPETRHSDS